MGCLLYTFEMMSISQNQTGAVQDRETIGHSQYNVSRRQDVLMKENNCGGGTYKIKLCQNHLGYIYINIQMQQFINRINSTKGVLLEVKNKVRILQAQLFLFPFCFLVF